jgi:hypothetical protein
MRVRPAEQCASAGSSLTKHCASRLQMLVPLNEAVAKDPGPLVAVCTEVLLAGCCGRQLKVAVVCLLATMLSERPTSQMLLHFAGSGARPRRRTRGGGAWMRRSRARGLGRGWQRMLLRLGVGA